MKNFKVESLILIILIPLVMLLSCDDGNSSNSSCTTEEDLITSECPASTLADFCGQFICPLTDLPEGVTGDLIFPPCDLECVMIDCSTLMCSGQVYSGIKVIETEDDGLDISGDGFFCLGAPEACE